MTKQTMLIVALVLAAVRAAPAQEISFKDLLDKTTEGFADSDGVPIHYVTMGQGPLLIMVHGYPDFWFTWRNQMPALAQKFTVVAVSQRGYNKSGKPTGVENYAMAKLTADIDAVRQHFNADTAVIVGHDWGGWVAWSYAMEYSQRTDRLIVVNLPHPKGVERELTHNPEQQKNSQYARNFQQPNWTASVDLEQMTTRIAGRYSDPVLKQYAIEAFKRSSLEGMQNYYKANYPRPPYTDDKEYPPVTCSVLLFHGLKDTALLHPMLNNTWMWIDKDLTLVTIPDAGHNAQSDAADLVTRTMVRWLGQ